MRFRNEHDRDNKPIFPGMRGDGYEFPLSQQPGGFHSSVGMSKSAARIVNQKPKGIDGKLSVF